MHQKNDLGMIQQNRCRTLTVKLWHADKGFDLAGLAEEGTPDLETGFSHCRNQCDQIKIAKGL